VSVVEARRPMPEVVLIVVEDVAKLPIPSKIGSPLLA
jgi:hypothetical protein